MKLCEVEERERGDTLRVEDGHPPALPSLKMGIFLLLKPSTLGMSSVTMNLRVRRKNSLCVQALLSMMLFYQ